MFQIIRIPTDKFLKPESEDIEVMGESIHECYVDDLAESVANESEHNQTVFAIEGGTVEIAAWLKRPWFTDRHMEWTRVQVGRMRSPYHETAHDMFMGMMQSVSVHQTAGDSERSLEMFELASAIGKYMCTGRGR